MGGPLGFTIMGYITIAIYNIAITKLLTSIISKVDLTEVLREKDPMANAVATTRTTQAARDGTDPTSPDNTSYSRLAGLIGATVMACFLWAVGNIFVFFVFAQQATQLPEIMKTVGTYFLAGAALFAPYGVNQLKQVFKTG